MPGVSEPNEAGQSPPISRQDTAPGPCRRLQDCLASAPCCTELCQNTAPRVIKSPALCAINPVHASPSCPWSRHLSCVQGALQGETSCHSSLCAIGGLDTIRSNAPFGRAKAIPTAGFGPRLNPKCSTALALALQQSSFGQVQPHAVRVGLFRQQRSQGMRSPTPHAKNQKHPLKGLRNSASAIRVRFGRGSALTADLEVAPEKCRCPTKGQPATQHRPQGEPVFVEPLCQYRWRSFGRRSRVTCAPHRQKRVSNRMPRIRAGSGTSAARKRAVVAHHALALQWGRVTVPILGQQCACAQSRQRRNISSRSTCINGL